MKDLNIDTFLKFDDVKKSYDQKNLVVKGFNMDVQEGEFITLLGPSGSGKTTVLMMLAGFESVTSGDIAIAGKSINRTAPYRRNIGMVFQNYALFPHMTVAENLAYPLAVRKMPKDKIKAQVAEYLNLVELSAFGDRRPGQLSGGQRQRVALARAMIFEPTLILMDEPLGALDKNLREQMQYEITRLHKQMGFTVIYVTHDQAEALSMSSRIAVFNDGVVQQCAPPAELYERPANAFVADFIGENNFVPGRVESIDGATAKIVTDGGTIVAQATADLTVGGACRVSVRPEKLFFPPSTHAHDNALTVRFETRIYVGDFIRYYFKLPDGTDIIVKILNDLSAPEFTDGAEAQLLWLASDCIAFQAG
ncbi:ABC transporter ATP-binding protein [Marinovum sp. 2_MG-2023]|uniref:ABC transporter ATP-binding protein n=1 Tax=Roseobacteraceae TaxID=2854170 RepID=UPI001FD1CDA7|nr:MULTISPECIES: ABC transporter ATP-binding protein [Roseobacteraceae]MCJ7873174.1 ABC transporter ATP-binding protein [Phaeobacter sp. J2-8]MDO6728955.1 ABC transporter ATP-binding protein [Marinovum sp. 2_MG-2023]MDO6779418.1 ABC transporter ATP-binding protein [Marinovum sp. 1_MG-2023]